jgi:hypothetical protein
MASSTKPKLRRSISPCKPLSAKKVKPEDIITQWGSPAPTFDQPLNGVERIRFDNSGPRRGDPIFWTYYRQKTIEKSNALARIGKKVVGSRDGIWL